jgi:hypothetical protein
MTEEELVDQQELFEHYRFKADPGLTDWRILPGHVFRMLPMRGIYW